MAFPVPGMAGALAAAVHVVTHPGSLPVGGLAKPHEVRTWLAGGRSSDAGSLPRGLLIAQCHTGSVARG